MIAKIKGNVAVLNRPLRFTASVMGLISVLLSPSYALADDPPSEACLNNPHATICGDEIVDPTLSEKDFYPSSHCTYVDIISSSTLWDLRITGSSANCNKHSNFVSIPNADYGISRDRKKTLKVPVGGSVSIVFKRGGESSEPDTITYNDIGSKDITIRCEDTFWDSGDCSFSGEHFKVAYTKWSISARNRLSAFSYDSNNKLAMSQCINYKGDGKFERDSCFDTRHFFYYNENTRKLQMKYRSWGGDWNPWGYSGGACFAYKGAGNFGLIPCDDDPGSWEFLEDGRIKYYTNPWHKPGGACLNFYDSKFSFYACGIEPSVDTPPPPPPSYPELDYDSLDMTDRLNAYFALLVVDHYIKRNQRVTLSHFKKGQGTYADFAHHYGVDALVALYYSGKVDVSQGLNWLP